VLTGNHKQGTARASAIRIPHDGPADLIVNTIDTAK
jgi:hypothetical protein